MLDTDRYACYIHNDSLMINLIKGGHRRVLTTSTIFMKPLIYLIKLTADFDNNFNVDNLYDNRAGAGAGRILFSAYIPIYILQYIA